LIGAALLEEAQRQVAARLARWSRSQTYPDCNAREIAPCSAFYAAVSAARARMTRQRPCASPAARIVPARGSAPRSRCAPPFTERAPTCRSACRGTGTGRGSAAAAGAALVKEPVGVRGHYLLRGEATMRIVQHRFKYEIVHADEEFAAIISFNSPPSISRTRSSAPPTSTPLTNTIGKVGHPVHILRALRRRQPPR